MVTKTIIRPDRFPWLDLSRYTFSMAVEKRGLVFVSGNSASEYDPAVKKVLCKGDVVAQSRVAFEKIGSILESAGLSFDNVVKTVDYVSPRALEGYPGTADVRREYFQGNWSAATSVVVETLLRPDALIEIEAIAVRDLKKEPINPGFDFRDYTYHPAVKAGQFIWCSGFTGSQEGVVAQTRDAFEDIGKVLSAAGSSSQQVLKSWDYLHPDALTDYPGTGDAKQDFFGNAFPAATGVVMNQLVQPGALVSVDVVATSGEVQEVIPPEWSDSYSGLTHRPGMQSGHLLYLSGSGDIDPQTDANQDVEDIVAQTRTAYQNIARVLQTAGGSLADVVKTVEFVAPEGLSNYRETAAVRREFFQDSFPAATGVVANRLRRPKMLIEVDAIAVLG